MQGKNTKFCHANNESLINVSYHVDYIFNIYIIK